MFAQTIDDMGCWKGPKRFIQYKWPSPTGLLGRTKSVVYFLQVNKRLTRRVNYQGSKTARVSFKWRQFKLSALVFQLTAHRGGKWEIKATEPRESQVAQVTDAADANATVAQMIQQLYSQCFMCAESRSADCWANANASSFAPSKNASGIIESSLTLILICLLLGKTWAFFFHVISSMRVSFINGVFTCWYCLMFWVVWAWALKRLIEQPLDSTEKCPRPDCTLSGAHSVFTLGLNNAAHHQDRFYFAIK